MSVGLGLGGPGTIRRLVYHERCCLLHSGSDVCEGLCVDSGNVILLLETNECRISVQSTRET